MNVLIVDDDDTLRELLGRELVRSGHRVAQAGSAGAGLASVAQSEPDVVLLDLVLPDGPGIDALRRLRSEHPALEVVVLTANGTVDTAIAAMKLGAFDYLQKPCHLQDLELTLDRALERRRLGEANAKLKDGLVPAPADDDLVGCGAGFDKLQHFVTRVAASDSTVLVRGETGTGKEMVARAVHRRSPRRAEPFVIVDCGALQETLLQSELFGHEKGAFTGADRLKHGLFETADGGTMFLDEIGDVSPAVQASLLRVLETSSFRRVGGTQEVHVDVRLIAATNRDLERLMGDGRFRTDLFFRLNTIHVELPPLRRRRHEIPCLVERFVERHNLRCGTHVTVSSEAMELLQRRYEWPGNVRELRHAVERAMILADGEVIRPRDLPPEIQDDGGAALLRATDGAPLPLVEVEARHIAAVLAEVGGHRARAAAALGISERSLYRKIREYHLDHLAKGSGEEG